MPQAPLPENEQQRLESLNALGVVYTPAEERFDRIVKIAAEKLNTPIALVSLVSSNFQWFKAAHGIGATQTPREVSFCAYTLLDGKPLVVENALEDERFSDNALVLGDPSIRAYAGEPLVTENGIYLGALCAIDTKPRDFTAEQLQSLKNLAKMVSEELARRSLTDSQTELVWESAEEERKNIIDEVTRLWNKDGIIPVLEKEVRKAHNTENLFIALLNIDGLARINDAHGFETGDAVLAETALRIRKKLVKGQACGRYAGDTFLLVFDQTSKAEATRLCQEILLSISVEPYHILGKDLAVSARAGIAQFNQKLTPTAKDLFMHATVALNQAKEAGGNTLR